MSLSTGARLGPYEIVAPLGAGGMGEVYRARDTKLQRDVALKVLPEVLARDAAPSDGSGSRLARFEREAQVLASLNHPNIAAIYGFKDTDGVPALVLEFVEGPTLAESAGPRAIEDALPIARQVADALEAAHEQGVVHRDLKPANVKVRPDGTVKVLDFGIAKLAEAAGVKPGGAGAEPTDLPTMTSASMQIGTILGTPAYMSPEQARGNPVDKRTDIWAFGCVLYEMLAGCRVFPGDNLSETLASVLRTQPDWHRLPSRTPPALHRLLRRCLEKDRGRRLPDVGVVRLEIDEALAELAGESAPLARPVRGRPCAPAGFPGRWRSSCLRRASYLRLSRTSAVRHPKRRSLRSRSIPLPARPRRASASRPTGNNSWTSASPTRDR